MRQEQWLFWEGVLDDIWCDEFVSNVLRLYPPEKTALVVQGNEPIEPDPEFRESEIRWLGVDREKELVELLMGYADRANRDAFDLETKWINELQFTTYKSSSNRKKMGKYGWHHDVDFKTPKPYHRKLSITVQLSDPSDYEGGDFEFKPGIDPLPKEVKEKGTILVFPSIYEHQVSPITQGIRHSLVTWVEGPHWR